MATCKEGEGSEFMSTSQLFVRGLGISGSVEKLDLFTCVFGVAFGGFFFNDCHPLVYCF
jgi:hypothetical protein